MSFLCLPNDVLGLISNELPWIDKYALAKTCRSLWERLRHFPSKDTYDLWENHKTGSFFFTTVFHVRVPISSRLVYSTLREALDKFFYLQTILLDIVEDGMSVSTATRLLRNIPMFPGPSALVITVPRHVYHEFTAAQRRLPEHHAFLTVKSADANSLPAKRKAVHNESSRTPSPVRRALAPLYENIATVKKSWSNDVTRLTPRSYVPAVLTDKCLITSGENYAKVDLDDHILSDINNAGDMQLIINTLAPKLLESVISWQENWVFITQVEFYLRNTTRIDDSAIVTKHNIYHNQLTAVIKSKAEMGRQWWEVSLFWQRLEILVTGGLCGEWQSKELVPFMRASVPLVRLPGQDTDTNDICCSAPGVHFVPRERSLQNYAKQSAGYKWACISKRFFEKGFASEHPLHISSTRSSSLMLASFLLKCIASQRYFQEDHAIALDLLSRCNFVKQLPAKKSKTLLLIRKDLEKKHGSNSDIHLVNCVQRLSELNGTNPMSKLEVKDAVALYRGKLASHCRNRSERIIRDRLYLL